MKASVLPSQRFAKMRAHTATHLLHMYLDELIGGTKQAGSLVDNDYLRFDFATKKPLNQEDIDRISQDINKLIYQAHEVCVEEMSFEQASKTGAKAFFEDSYGDMVRVVSITGEDISSVELCGGTHVQNTKDIGAFFIIGQESVASGVRRITAVTGPKVAQHLQELTNNFHAISQKFNSQPKQIYEKIDKFLKDHEELTQSYNTLQAGIISNQLDVLFEQSESKANTRGLDYIIDISESDLAAQNFKEIVQAAKQTQNEKNWLLYSQAGSFALYCGAGDISAKQLAQEKQLRGGGSDQLVQGKDTTLQDKLV